MREKKCGIYMIKNLVNGRVYIGSTKDMYRRFYTHRRYLKNNTHDNKYLQRSYNKYGRKAFKFSIIEECPVEKLIEREQYWVDWYKTNGKVYNLRLDCVNGNRGVKHSEETRRKMSESHKAKKKIISKEQRKIISEANKGKVLSKEHMKKLIEINTGRVFTKEHKQKISKALTGKHLSEETKQKIREKLKGRKHTEEQIINSTEGRRGYKHSEETKKKISEGNKGKLSGRKLSEETIIKRNETRKKNKLLIKEKIK